MRAILLVRDAACPISTGEGTLRPRTDHVTSTTETLKLKPRADLSGFMARTTRKAWESEEASSPERQSSIALTSKKDTCPGPARAPPRTSRGGGGGGGGGGGTRGGAEEAGEVQRLVGGGGGA